MSRVPMLVTLTILACTKPAPPVRTADVAPPYERTVWGGWRDEDHDCQTTRVEVLLAEATGPVEFRSDRECVIESGE